MTISIRIATSKDITSLKNIFDKCTLWLQKRGFHHWDNYYTRERIIQNMKTGKVYLLLKDYRPIGTITISTVVENNYWKNTKKALYPTGLAIIPKYHKKKLSNYLLDLAIKKAKEQKCKVIRFDAVGNSLELTSYYLHWGAKIVGIIGDKNKTHGNLYEKKVD